LEKTPIQYIQWRFQDGHDRESNSDLCMVLWALTKRGFVAGEVLEKVTRVLTDTEKAQMEVEFVGKNGQRRKLEVCGFVL
jgi:elongation factor 3